ncbi:MAG: hypothetical protein JWN40_3846 [Phycisphaerales bacterium]|nr:hypothetical protein [Phycisphaerales bacterium]
MSYTEGTYKGLPVITPDPAGGARIHNDAIKAIGDNLETLNAVGVSGYSGYSGSGRSGYSGFSGRSGWSGFSGADGLPATYTINYTQNGGGECGGSSFATGVNVTLAKESSTLWRYDDGNNNFVEIRSDGTYWRLRVEDVLGCNGGGSDITWIASIINEGGTPNPYPPVGASNWTVESDSWAAGSVLNLVTNAYVGASGAAGASGYSGYSGKSGFSGYSGFSGRSGFSGYSGSGTSGYSGKSGFSGWSGISGATGAPGADGSTGVQIQTNGSFVGTEGKLNLIAGTGIDISGSDTPGDVVNVTITSTGGGGSSGTILASNNGVLIATEYGLDFINGTGSTVTVADVGGGNATVRVDVDLSGVSGYGSPGADGASGFSGRSGFSGYSGSGTSGYSGRSGYSGYSGYSGATPSLTGYAQLSGAAFAGTTSVGYNGDNLVSVASNNGNAAGLQFLSIGYRAGYIIQNSAGMFFLEDGGAVSAGPFDPTTLQAACAFKVASKNVTYYGSLGAGALDVSGTGHRHLSACSTNSNSAVLDLGCVGVRGGVVAICDDAQMYFGNHTGLADYNTATIAAAAQLVINSGGVVECRSGLKVTGDIAHGAYKVDKDITLTDGSTTTWDQSLGDRASWTVGGARTLAFSNARAGTFILRLIQDGTGSRTVTWPASVKWPAGSAPTLSTAIGAVDIVSLYSPNGTTFYAVWNGAFA